MAIIIIIKFEKLENDFLKGHDNYLKTPTEAYNLRNNSQRELDLVAFFTEGKKLMK